MPNEYNSESSTPLQSGSINTPNTDPSSENTSGSQPINGQKAFEDQMPPQQPHPNIPPRQDNQQAPPQQPYYNAPYGQPYYANQQQPYYPPYPPYPPREEKANAGLAVLSWFIPLAGLIIYLTEKDTKPKTASVCGKCALASFIINVVLVVVFYIVFFAAWATAFSTITDYDFADDYIPASSGICEYSNYNESAVFNYEF